jgi:hypothetical protein
MSALFSNGEMVGGSVENTNFTSSDVADGQATSWTTVTPIVDDEPNVSLFTKLSQMAKNVRYLYKMLGNIDYLCTWKPLCDVTGSTETPLPSTWNEIHVTLIMPTEQFVTMRILPSDVTTYDQLVSVSYWYAPTCYAFFGVNVNSNTGIKLSLVNTNISQITHENMRMVCKYR